MVLIGFFALVAVGVFLEWALRRLRRPGALGRMIAIGLPVLVLVFGVWDTAVPYRDDQAEELPKVQAIRSLVGELEQELPDDAAVFQLPVFPFPESGPRGRVHGYEALLPILYSDDLRWSFGGNRGRPESDWQKQVDSADPAPSLPGLVGLGFEGILIDTWLYDDGGVAATASLEEALGAPTHVAGEGDRWRYWDLRSVAADTGLSTDEMRQAAEALVGPDLIGDVPVTPA